MIKRRVTIAILCICSMPVLSQVPRVEFKMVADEQLVLPWNMRGIGKPDSLVFKDMILTYDVESTNCTRRYIDSLNNKARENMQLARSWHCDRMVVIVQPENGISFIITTYLKKNRPFGFH